MSETETELKPCFFCEEAGGSVEAWGAHDIHAVNRRCGDCKYFKQCGTLDAMKAAHLPVSYDAWHCADFMKREG